MLTFTQMYTEVYQGCGLPASDSVNINLIKRNINNGLKLMKSAAAQYYTRKEVTASLVEGQQYYTFNPDMIRVRNVRVNNGSLIFPIGTVESENMWNYLNIIPSFAVFYPQRWFIRGPNEIGIWPLPAVDVANALIIAYDSRMEDMYLDDTAGISLTVTNNSTTVTTTGVGSNQFNANMVGMKFTFTDGSDGQWYSIVGYTDSTHMTIENFYPNATQTSTATIIGSCPDIPEEFQPGLQDYAFYRYYKTQRSSASLANDFKNDFLLAQEGYVGTFGDKESSQIILPRNNNLSYDPFLVPPINMSQN
jgi:hypothetical protein